MRRFALLAISLVVVGLLATAPALAAPPDGGGVIVWDGDYTLAAGEQIAGDLVVVNGDVTLAAGSTVQGSVAVWNGQADVQGTVEGSLLVSGGRLHLGETASVGGDVVCSDECRLDRADGAHVGGAVTLEENLAGPWRLGGPLVVWRAGLGRMLGWAFHAARFVAGLLVMAVVAGLVALVWPRWTSRVGQVVVAAPWYRTLLLGALTCGAALTVSVVLLLTLCLAPLGLILLLILGAAGLFGWVGVGAVVGRRLLPQRDSLPLVAGVGTLFITLAAAAVTALPCLSPLGWVLTLGLWCLGLGAVVLSTVG